MITNEKDKQPNLLAKRYKLICFKQQYNYLTLPVVLMFLKYIMLTKDKCINYSKNSNAVKYFTM